MDKLQLAAYEISLVLIQYRSKKLFHLAFMDQIPMILKIVDLVLMAICAKLLFILKTPSRLDVFFGTLCLLRIAVQVYLCLDLSAESGKLTMERNVMLSLHLIFHYYQSQLPQIKYLHLLSQLFLLGLILTTIHANEDFVILAGKIVITISVLHSFKQKQSLQIVEEKPKDFDICISALPRKQQDESQFVPSPVYGGLSSPLRDQSKSMDAQILDDYAWIKGQQFIVLDEYENVVLQTFNVANFSKSSFSGSMEYDSVNQILGLGIVAGNKDFQELMISSQQICQQKFTLKDLINKIASDYELHKNSLFVVNRVDALWMQDWMLKVFLICKFRRVFIFIQIEQKEVSQQPQHQSFNQFTQYMTNSLNTIMTLSSLAEYDKSINELILEKYFYPIRIASVQIYLNMANLRDYNLHNQKKLLLKIHTLNIMNALEDLILFFQDSARAKSIEIRIEVEDVETIETDSERLKQLLYPLLKFFVKESKQDILVINFKSISLRNYQCTISSQIAIDERDIRKFRLDIKKALLQYSDVSVSQILAQYLSGTLKKGIEIQSSEMNGTTFSFFIQSPETGNEEMKVIKLINASHYYETSLSQILAHNISAESRQQQYELSNTLFREGTHTLLKQSQDCSLHFSQSHISKQLSQKFSEYQSAYLSQVSRIKADSVVNTYQKKDQPSFEYVSIQNVQMDDDGMRLKNNTSPSQTKYQLPHFPETEILNLKNEEGGEEEILSNIQVRGREQTFLSQPVEQSVIDFGSDINQEAIRIPVTIMPKMQSQIIKFSAFGQCCSRVMVADSEFQTMQILEIILGAQKIEVTRAFSTEEALKIINNKPTCKCGNRGFVLYFVSIDLPKKGGLWFCRLLKERMKSDIQKGYVIATTGMIDYYSKVEYYRHGIDQYISLPYDLVEVNQILRYLK